MREEIAAGIKSSMERGYSLEQSAQTFINAGYNPQEVMAAQKMLASGIMTTARPEKEDSKEKKFEETNSLPQLPKAGDLKKEIGRRKKVVLIIITVMALTVFLAALGYLIFKLNK